MSRSWKQSISSSRLSRVMPESRWTWRSNEGLEVLKSIDKSNQEIVHQKEGPPFAFFWVAKMDGVPFCRSNPLGFDANTLHLHLFRHEFDWKKAVDVSPDESFSPPPIHDQHQSSLVANHHRPWMKGWDGNWGVHDLVVFGLGGVTKQHSVWNPFWDRKTLEPSIS